MQAKRALAENGVEVWVKPLGDGNSRAIALLNRGETEKQFSLSAARVGLSPKSNLRNLWRHKELGKISSKRDFVLPKHGIIVLKAS
ncbi:hypothetical protein [Hymenobacter crusticola]|uniref:Alpha galactosidase C-terminal domain-containing protein n=1 Tax=Hymenobacter crusticola TaxID=1770526 RepID=A0A243W7F6_9BACT|nr:hypothetical protein BXP70_22870 [Hymenobacter crusticola]